MIAARWTNEHKVLTSFDGQSNGLALNPFDIEIKTQADKSAETMTSRNWKVYGKMNLNI